MVLTSADASGAADASPKGDPPVVRVLDGRRIAVPDRPGNRRTDSFHNLLSSPSIALLALVPRSTRLVEVVGHATLTNDAELRASMAVDGKVPRIALVLDADRAEVRDVPALAALWEPTARPEPIPNMTRMWVDHIKSNNDRGVAAKAMRAVVSERLLRRIGKDDPLC